MITRPRRRVALLGALGALLVGLVLSAAPTAAVAAPEPGAAPVAAAPASGEGWLRLGHFSPDTKQVDVRVTALSGGSIVLSLSNVGYGTVSPYSPLPAGTYAVAMVGAGSNNWNKPVISAQVTIAAGTASTVAAYGPNARLKVQAFTDDLTPPTVGTARIRVIQASTLTPTVSIATSTGLTIAKNVAAGSSTAYAEVPAGPWTLQLTGQNVSDSATIDVAAGSVTTLFVLDTADRGLTILPVLDSAASPTVPVSGIQTGAGGAAPLVASRRASLLG